LGLIYNSLKNNTKGEREEFKKKRAIKLGINGSRGSVQVGRWTYYGRSVFSGFHRNDFLKIGSFCSIANDVRFQICSGNHFINRISNFPVDYFFHEARTDNHKNFTMIGNDVWIGARAVILPGIRIGNGAVIGAGSVVREDIEAFSVVAGNPTKHVKWRFESKEMRETIQSIGWWNWSDEEIKERKSFFVSKIEDAIETAKKNKWISAEGIPSSYLNEIIEFFPNGFAAEELDKKTREFLFIDDSALMLNKYKTQSYENISVWIAALSEIRPKCIVELGTQTGCSASILARLCRFLGLNTKIITINIKDEAIYKDKDVEYVIEEFTGKVEEIWKRWSPDIIFQDAHMYHLIHQILIESENNHRNTIHFLHDTGFRLFKNPMKIPLEAVPTSETGSWERHVLALYDKKLLEKSYRDVKQKTFKIHIFDGSSDSNEFGLGILKFSNDTKN